jgi:hypothetical protein
MQARTGFTPNKALGARARTGGSLGRFRHRGPVSVMCTGSTLESRIHFRHGQLHCWVYLLLIERRYINSVEEIVFVFRRVRKIAKSTY